jgi:hypothetical protein
MSVDSISYSRLYGCPSLQQDWQPCQPELNKKISEMSLTEVCYPSNLQRPSPSRAPSMAMAFPARTLTGQSQSAFTKLRLAASRAATPPVAPWPSPGLSIGQSCTPLSGNKCWEVIGPALGMSVGILRAVKELLDPHAEYLHEKEPKPCFIAFGMYMIGRDEHKANPTLLISCERKSPRQKAVKLVRESPILKENAGVRLAESPRPPLCSVSPIPLGPSNDENNNSPHRVSAGENLYLAPKEFTCGIPIYTKMVQSHNASYPPRGTVGGIVCIKDDLFGISTAHGFAEDHKELALPDDEMSFEILFDDWIESDGTSQEVEHTHDQGKSIYQFELSHHDLIYHSNSPEDGSFC